MEVRGRKAKNPKRVRTLSGFFAFCLSPQCEPPPLFFMSSSEGLRLEVISQSPQKGQERLSGAFALCLSPQSEPPPLFFMSSSGGLRLEVISQSPQKGTERLSGAFALCLSPQSKPPPLFFVQLRRVEARGHKPENPKRHRTPFRVLCLMLVASARPASAFLCPAPRA